MFAEPTGQRFAGADIASQLLVQQLQEEAVLFGRRDGHEPFVLGVAEQRDGTVARVLTGKKDVAGSRLNRNLDMDSAAGALDVDERDGW